MLRSLSIKNIVLIDDLQIDFGKGLSVLTGETGAGKSILLDALGLAIGARSDPKLIRGGTTSAQVTAVFSVQPFHPILAELEVQEIQHEDGELVFRRHLDVDGKNKCFINDQLISQTLMRKLGQSLVEIHGQFEGLLDSKSHMKAIDTYGKIETSSIQKAYQLYVEASEELQAFKEKLAKSLERQTFIKFAIEELEKVAPQLGEEEVLDQERSYIAHRAKIADALLIVDQSCSVALTEIAGVHKALSRVSDLAPEKITPLLEASDRSLVELQEVLEGMRNLRDDVNGTQQSLEDIENRLHTLRTLSRKYQCVDLVDCLETFREEISQLENGENHIHLLEDKVNQYKNEYKVLAETLSNERKKIAKSIEVAINKELPPLKLDQARFRVHFEELPESSWGPKGKDCVEFYIQTNPGSPEGPLCEIASGGELSRLMLALKVVLVQTSSVPTLIFDEIESGTGGAVASAIGDRLKSLTEMIQVLAITHSPQIASCGDHHFVVFKVMAEKVTTTHVRALDQGEKTEEVARMLAGEEVTDAARMAAKSLMGVTR